MASQDIIAGAVAAVGAGRLDDYVVAPTKHANELEQRAPALAAALRRPQIETLAQRYERLDREAIDAQRRFKRATNHANAAVLTTTVLSALILTAGLLSAGNVRSVLLILLGLLALGAGAYASFWLYRVREGRLLDVWMSARARTEMTRLAYFRAIVEAGGEVSSGIPLDLLKLEYFRRYQLDVQIAYYGARRRDHGQSADRTLTLGGFAVAGGGLASAGAGLLGAYAPPVAALAVLGVVGTGLGAFAATREAINQDRRNAERYGRTLEALEMLRGRMEEVRKAVLGNNTKALSDFVDAVQDELSLEHRQWLEATEGGHAAIERLDRTLVELKAAAGASSSDQ